MPSDTSESAFKSHGYYECSICGAREIVSNSNGEDLFCPYCGKFNFNFKAPRSFSKATKNVSALSCQNLQKNRSGAMSDVSKLKFGSSSSSNSHLAQNLDFSTKINSKNQLARLLKNHIFKFFRVASLTSYTKQKLKMDGCSYLYVPRLRQKFLIKEINFYYDLTKFNVGDYYETEFKIYVPIDGINIFKWDVIILNNDYFLFDSSVKFEKKLKRKKCGKREIDALNRDLVIIIDLAFYNFKNKTAKEQKITIMQLIEIGYYKIIWFYTYFVPKNSIDLTLRLWVSVIKHQIEERTGLFYYFDSLKKSLNLFLNFIEMKSDFELSYCKQNSEFISNLLKHQAVYLRELLREPT